MEVEDCATGLALAALEENVREALGVFLSGERSVKGSLRRASDVWRHFAPLLPVSRKAIDAVRRAGQQVGNSFEAFERGPVISGMGGAKSEPPAEGALDEFERAVGVLEAGRSGGSERELAEMVAAGYRLLDSLHEDRKALATDGEHRIAAPCIDPRDYEERYLRPVAGLHAYAGRALKPFIAGLYLHGSLATLDFACDYSDFDTLIVVRRDVVADADRLLAFLPVYRRSMCFLFEFDPLQHHAHILLTEIELESYSDTLFPLDVLGHARALGEEWEPLRVHRRPSAGTMLEEFERVCAAFSRLAESRYQPDNAYDLKSFLSELMLLPALYLQSLGKPCYKKYSFEESAPDFPADVWSVMDEASAIRAGWRYERRGDSLRAAAGRLFDSLPSSPEIARRIAANPGSAVVREAARIAMPEFVGRAAALASEMRLRVRRAAGENRDR